jgi:hypothetical protein
MARETSRCRPISRLLEEFGYAALVAHIALHRHGVRQGVRSGHRSGCVDIGDDHGGALSGVGPRDRVTDTAGGSGDDGDLTDERTLGSFRCAFSKRSV